MRLQWLLLAVVLPCAAPGRPDPHAKDPVDGTKIPGLQPTRESCDPGTVGEGSDAATRNVTSAILMLVDFDRIESRLRYMEPQLQNFAKMPWLKLYCVYCKLASPRAMDDDQRIDRPAALDRQICTRETPVP